MKGTKKLLCEFSIIFCGSYSDHDDIDVYTHTQEMHTQRTELQVTEKGFSVNL